MHSGEKSLTGELGVSVFLQPSYISLIVLFVELFF